MIVDIQEVSLRDKPQSMLDASSKVTVPVLCVGSKVIDETIDSMLGKEIGYHQSCL